MVVEHFTMTKPNPHGRLSNTTTCLPIAYGSIAFYLGSKSDEYRTHKWTLYIRSPDPTYDISSAISKVIFQLHPSFAQPTREITEPPYEVTETGWGEFEASIRIVWKEDSEERSTILTHGIKLYPKNVPANLMTMDLAAYMTTTVPGMCVYVYIDMMWGA
jgi:YEATS domain-containing protein 4